MSSDSDTPKVKSTPMQIEPGHGLKQGHDHAKTQNTPVGPQSNPSAWPANKRGK